MTIHKYVGLDVHKDHFTVTIAEGGRDGEVRCYGNITSSMHSVERLIGKIGGEDVCLHFVYEAGPTGFTLCRHLLRMGHDCKVVTPASVSATNSKRKTDKRDSTALARLHRAGELTPIHIPSPVDESIRDLCRARANAVTSHTASKLQLKAFLLRHGFRYTGAANWSEAHQRYLRALTMPLPSSQAVLEELILQIDSALARVARFDALLEVHVPEWHLYPAVKALMCLRGVQLVAASVLISELGDIRRFAHPSHLMAFLGLVPSENSTGKSRRTGSITKAGNSHARWILVEIVLHAFKHPAVSAQLSKRQEGQPAIYKELAWKAQNRLFKRSRALLMRGLTRNKVTIALAREMAGFVWDILRNVPPPKVA